jgi:aryl-alcohol dehydrogenase-like predicted oxidoreductase
VLTYSPLARGIPTGKYTPDTPFPEGSRAARKDVRMQQAELREESIEISQRIVEHCEARGVPTSRFAMAWCLANPHVTSIVLGPRTMEQFDDNMGCLDVVIEEADEAFVDDLVPPGTHTGKGFRDPAYPITGRPAGNV